jgi:flagellar motility protein MotE (MotC chaperone)
MGMMRLIRDIRLIPIALIASACLLVLTVANLMFEGGGWLAADWTPAQNNAAAVGASSDDAPASAAKSSWAQQMFDFPSGQGQAPPGKVVPPIDAASAAATNSDVTGSIETKPTVTKSTTAPKAGSAAAGKDGQSGKQNGKAGVPIGETAPPVSGVTLPSGAKLAILERLEQRREQLDARSRELDIRENLVKAAEQRIAAHLAEVKGVEARIAAETKENNAADGARFKALVTMYENMKARDAAKIFNGLEMPILLKVASRINPRAMADIMAQMAPQKAERLTVEMAGKAQPGGKDEHAELPKIEGRPTSP